MTRFRRRFSTRWLFLCCLGLLGAAALALAGPPGLGLVTWEHHRGYFGPAISPDGSRVWFFEREASGLAVGPGWEHFTPPARVFLREDALALKRLDLATGGIETLVRWKKSPLAGRSLKYYRGRVLGILSARIRLAGEGEGDYNARIAVYRVPTSEVWSLEGQWPAPVGTPGWAAGDVSQSGLSEPVVAGDLEVLALPGAESFPAAVILLDHGRRKVEVLVGNDRFEDLYPDSVHFEALLEHSRKAEVDRRAEMEQTYRRLVRNYRQEGMLETAARLQAGDEMVRIGWWPTPPSLVASAVESFPPDLEVFVFDPMEFRVGLFPDIEKAIARPGERVERFGRYVRHDDYDTSERLNAFLASDPDAFGVRVGERRWRIDLIPRQPATR